MDSFLSTLNPPGVLGRVTQSLPTCFLFVEKVLAAFLNSQDRNSCHVVFEWGSMLHGSHIYCLRMTALFLRKLLPGEHLDCTLYLKHTELAREMVLLDLGNMHA
jgi:hypothetical protein